ncbi:membrane protein containing Mechanosensitive ion channel MscS [Candidatus Magnetomorum sp. HK-1]|nr:membrane protein containing Mechanosensitive ion channel MscS [Candidatus Magnetomorum sp. HK-1]
MKTKWVLLIISMIALLSFLFIEWFISSKQEKSPLHIAIVGPMTGQGQMIGRSMKRGINLKINEINAQGGVHGHPVIPQYYDDNNIIEEAQKIAFQISTNSPAIGVIGHWYSTCSISAGEIYQKYRIPVITPGATNVLVTKFNPWYFRTVFNDSLQGQFIANYVKNVIQYNNACIIHEDDTYGNYLATVFEARSQSLGINICFIKKFQSQSSNIDEQLDNLIHALKIKESVKSNHRCIIFLATHAAEGVELVRRIKDAGLPHTIIGPDSFGSQNFQKGFDNFPKEKANPGYYMSGVYTTTHLIFDTAGKKAQEFKTHYQTVYREDPDWISAYVYDTAEVLIKAMQRTSQVSNAKALTANRAIIRQSLTNFRTFKSAVKGVTGEIYFDEKGDAVNRPVSIGVYKGRHLISAMTQLHAIPNLIDPELISQEIKNKHIIKLEGQYMYQTQVIYTGVELIEIKKFDDKKLYCDLEFYLWFRCRKDIEIQAEDLIFKNKIQPDISQKGSSWQDQIKQVSIKTYSDQTQYKLFRVMGRFQTDRIKNAGDLDRHFLNICFRHKKLPRKNLIFVIDLVGMGLSQQNISDMEDTILSGELSRWRIIDQKVYQDIWEEKRPQNRISELADDHSNNFSRFHFGVVLQKNKFSLRGLIPKSFVKPLLIITLLVNILFFLINLKYDLPVLKRSMLALEAVSAFVFWLSAEIFILNRLSNYLNAYHLSLIKSLFDIVWWLLPAYFINLAVKRFLWAPIKQATGHSAPKIIRHFFSFIIYLTAFIGIVAFVYEQEISKILATGGLFAMIIGFAVQMNISNLISGIAINFENPFRIGDWVKIGDAEGKVVDITWRSTRIKTAENCVFSIPNSMATESFIANFNYPDDINWLTITPHIDPITDPQKVKKILIDAVLSANNILKIPEPYVIYKGITEWASDFQVFFSIKDFANKQQDLEMVWKRIWKHLEYAGIQTIIQEQAFPLEHKDPVFFLNEMALFQSLNNNEKESLLTKMVCHIFPPQKTIIKEGDFGDSLFFIQEGAINVQLRVEEDEALIEINRLGVGSFFGEMAFFSDHHRTASIVTLGHCEIYEIKEKDFMPLLTKYPEMTKALTKEQMSRKEQQTHEKELHLKTEGDQEDLPSRIWSRFFPKF